MIRTVAQWFQPPPGTRKLPLRKPANLIYGTDDIPPLSTTLMLGFQHAFESASKIALPIAVLTAAGAGDRQVETMIVATLLVCGIASALISSRHRLLGFGNLLPLAIFSSFVSPAAMAVRIGGLKLLAGMTLTTGAVVCAMSRTLHRLRTLFPPEAVGLIAFMVGASQASIAVMSFLGVSRSDQAPSGVHIAIAAITLATSPASPSGAEASRVSSVLSLRSWSAICFRQPWEWSARPNGKPSKTPPGSASRTWNSPESRSIPASFCRSSCSASPPPSKPKAISPSPAKSATPIGNAPICAPAVAASSPCRWPPWCQPAPADSP